MIAAIVAKAKNGVIGMEGDLPWHLPADLAHFRTVTMGCNVIMGRKTFDSVAMKAGGPLPGRRNIVVSRNVTYRPEGDVTVVSSVDKAVHLVTDSEVDTFVIGGTDVYDQMMLYVSRIYMTEVAGEFEGDRHFPALDMSQWKEVSREDHKEDERNHHDYSFVVLDRVHDDV